MTKLIDERVTTGDCLSGKSVNNKFLVMENAGHHYKHVMLHNYRLGKKATPTHKEMVTVDPGVVSQKTVYRWFGRFDLGNYDLSIMSGRGRKRTIDRETLLAIAEEDPRLSLREMAILMDCSHTTVANILRELGKVQKLGKWVPHMLTALNKANRVSIAERLLTRHRFEPFLERVITGDEKWVLYTNVCRRKQWVDQDQQPDPTARPGLHPKKIMLCIWWDVRGVVHWELLKKGQTVTAELYCQQLARVNEILPKIRPRLVNRDGIVLLHDNARPHTARLTKNKINEMGWELLDHPPYSPDLAPTDYHLFRSLQHHLAGKTFADEEAVRRDITLFIDNKSKKTGFFRRGIEGLVQRWTDVIEKGGDYLID